MPGGGVPGRRPGGRPGPFLPEPVPMGRLPSGRSTDAHPAGRQAAAADRGAPGGIGVSPGTGGPPSGDLRGPLPRRRGADAARPRGDRGGGARGGGPVRLGGGGEEGAAPPEAPGDDADRGAGPGGGLPAARGDGGPVVAGLGVPRRGGPVRAEDDLRKSRGADGGPPGRDAPAVPVRRPGDGEAGRAGAQFQLRRRPDLPLRDRPGGSRGRPPAAFPAPVFRPAGRDGLADHIGSDGGRVRLPRGPAAAPRGDARGTGQLAARRGDLLRVLGTDLGAGGAHQGAARRGGPVAGGGVPAVARPVRLPEVHGFHLHRRDQGDEGPHQPGGRARPEGGAGPEAGRGRDPGDRVLRPGAPAHLRREGAVAAAPRHGGDARGPLAAADRHREGAGRAGRGVRVPSKARAQDPGPPGTADARPAAGGGGPAPAGADDGPSGPAGAGRGARTGQRRRAPDLQPSLRGGARGGPVRDSRGRPDPVPATARCPRTRRSGCPTWDSGTPRRRGRTWTS